MVWQKFHLIIDVVEQNTRIQLISRQQCKGNGVFIVIIFGESNSFVTEVNLHRYNIVFTVTERLSYE